MMLAITALCGMAAGAIGLFGFMMLSQATLGVGMVAGACLLAIFARMAQAAAYQDELMAPRRQVKHPPEHVGPS